ncbi:M48 family metallopeptidase [Mannheimia varigena]|uniref:M48 family metallopeptidase n=1 Tax=Mannheimia varigena TaxID=85404 RepID=UPI001105A122|nr:SprT family zinc-dependent metalloprotease [Mannheimia varigena]TLU76186.1 M48 family metallopeptidase [Mannheimia varigena]
MAANSIQEWLAIPYGESHLTVGIIPQAHLKQVRLTMQPNGEIIAKVPPQAVKNELIFAISKQTQWIAKQQRHFSQLPKSRERHYISGESHRYLGRQYQLKVYETPDLPNQVKLFRGYLEIYVQQKTTENVKKCLHQWYRQRAKQIFQERLSHLLPQALWATAQPEIRLRTMQKRWGSCSVKGRLLLNPLLVQAPKACIDYVILHELCHLAEHNHSDRFYRLMTAVMPSWEAVKEQLEKIGE